MNKINLKSILTNLGKEDIIKILDKYFDHSNLVELLVPELIKLREEKKWPKDFEQEFIREIEVGQEKIHQGKLVHNQFVKEVESFQEKDAATKKIIHRFFEEIESHQEILASSSNVANQFVREIEKSQERLISSGSINKEFVKEIENSQEKLSKLDKITRQFITELETSQEQLHFTLKSYENLRKFTQELFYYTSELFSTDNLMDVEGCREKMEINLEKIMIELQTLSEKMTPT